jgi:MFS family permease
VQLLTAPIAVTAGGLTFLWSAFFIGRIRTPETPPTPTADREPVLHEIRNGLGLLLGDPVLRPIALASACLGGLYGIVGATWLLFAIRDLGLSPVVVGIVTGLGGVGSLIGAVMAGRITRKFGLGRALVWALALGSLGSFFIPLAPAGLPLVAIACLLAQQVIGDSAITVFEIDDVTVRQSVVPDRWLGRVNASTHVLSLVAQLGGTVIGGLLAEGIGIRGALVVGSLGGLLGAAVIFFSPVRRLLDVPGRPAEGLLAQVLPGEDIPLGE